MPTEKQKQGGDLFIVDNSNEAWKAVRYLHDWADIAHTLDIATGYFEIGALLALDGQWQKLDKLRILMGDEVSGRTVSGLTVPRPPVPGLPARPSPRPVMCTECAPPLAGSIG